jgi:hypothetical protein
MAWVERKRQDDASKYTLQRRGEIELAPARAATSAELIGTA